MAVIGMLVGTHTHINEGGDMTLMNVTNCVPVLSIPGQSAIAVVIWVDASVTELGVKVRHKESGAVVWNSEVLKLRPLNRDQIVSIKSKSFVVPASGLYFVEVFNGKDATPIHQVQIRFSTIAEFSAFNRL